MDTFRAGGKGGQNQNKRDSGVRITHLPSGLSSESREHKEQLQNKRAAFQRLSRKIIQWHRDQEADPHDELPPSETVRTYHAVENRVKDHDSGFRQSYTEVMHDIGLMIEARREHKLSICND